MFLLWLWYMMSWIAAVVMTRLCWCEPRDPVGVCVVEAGAARFVGVRACDMSHNRDLCKRQRQKMRVKFRALGDVEAGRAAETIRSQKSEIRISDLNILPMLACFVHYYMFANTRFVWVEINNIGPKNTLLQRSAPSGIWYFPNKWYFSTGISIPIPSTVQIALCSRWYCYLVFVSGISKCYGIDTAGRWEVTSKIETLDIRLSIRTPQGAKRQHTDLVCGYSGNLLTSGFPSTILESGSRG